jgi:hypothetical protein
MRKWIAVMAVLGGCSSSAVPDMDPGAGGPEELGSSLNVRVAEDSVRLELHVTNVASSPIPLEFNTTQRYDFEVSELDGDRVWRWSDGRAFGEALGREVLQPGESRRYAAAWAADGREGEYVATARIVSGNYPVELRTVFALPE